jgi:hypothetical protein
MNQAQAIKSADEIKKFVKNIPGTWIKETREEKPELRMIIIEVSIRVDK